MYKKYLGRLHIMLCLDIFVAFLELKFMKIDFENYLHVTGSSIKMLKQIFY